MQKIDEEPEQTVTVLLGGVASKAALWNDFIDEYLRLCQELGIPATEFLCIELPPGITSIEEMAAWVGEELDRRGLKKVNLMGVSFGGAIAQELALQRPRLVRKLVLMSTCAGAFSMPGNIFSMFAMLAKSRSLPADERHGLLEVIGRSLATLTWTSRGRLGRLNMPTMVLHGALDGVVPLPNALELHFSIRGSILRIVPWGTHYIVVKRVAEVAALLAEFLYEEAAVLPAIAA